MMGVVARTAEELHGAAVDLVNRGKVAAARRMLASAAEAAVDANLRARIAGTMAYALARVGEVLEAEGVNMARDAAAVLARDPFLAGLAASGQAEGMASLGRAVGEARRSRLALEERAGFTARPEAWW